MSALKTLQVKPRNKRTPIEQCIVDAAIFEEAERDGEFEIMEQAAADYIKLIDAAKLVVRRRNVGALLEAVDGLKSAVTKMEKL